jgi:hypothetical protein
MMPDVEWREEGVKRTRRDRSVALIHNQTEKSAPSVGPPVQERPFKERNGCRGFPVRVRRRDPMADVRPQARLRRLVLRRATVEYLHTQFVDLLEPISRTTGSGATAILGETTDLH